MCRSHVIVPMGHYEPPEDFCTAKQRYIEDADCEDCPMNDERTDRDIQDDKDDEQYHAQF